MLAIRYLLMPVTEKFHDCHFFFLSSSCYLPSASLISISISIFSPSFLFFHFTSIDFSSNSHHSYSTIKKKNSSIPFPSSQESWWWQFIFMLFPDFIFFHYVLYVSLHFLLFIFMYVHVYIFYVHKRNSLEKEAHCHGRKWRTTQKNYIL